MTTKNHSPGNHATSTGWTLFIAVCVVVASGCHDTAPPPPVIRAAPAPSAGNRSGDAPPIVTQTPIAPPSDYVGSQVCAECHQEISQSYARTTMAKSAASLPDAPVIEKYPCDRIEAARGLYLSASQTTAGVFHHEQLLSIDGQLLCEQTVPIAYELGSGKRGRSYLVERDDQLMMSPLTWYSTALRWDVSPGYERNNQHFERRVTDGCLQCHAGRIAAAPSPQRDRYARPVLLEAMIGCERCHGPAEKHVAFQRSRTPSDGAVAAAASPGPDPIVNPGSLPPHLRESVCNECHDLGSERVLRFGKTEKDFRPGDPLSSIWVTFQKGHSGANLGQSLEAVNQVQQMEASQCFQQSNGQMGCISCHDPHRQPDAGERVEFFRNKCLACHTQPQQECATPKAERRLKSPEDSCIACHMPASPAADVQHTSQTDHRILRLPAASQVASGEGAFRIGAGMDSVPEWEVERARGLLMTRFAIELKDAELAKATCGVLEPLVERGLHDPIVERSLGEAYHVMNFHEKAEQHWKQALTLNPHDETALRSYAIAMHASGRDEEAESLYARYLQNNRWDRVILGRHVHVLARLQRLDEALREAEEAVQKFPLDGQIRQWLADAYEASGRVADAQAQRAVIERLAPVP